MRDLVLVCTGCTFQLDTQLTSLAGAISFDWNYIAGLGSPLWYPLYALTNSFIGYLGCTILFMGLYYGNIWRAQDFPFLAQQLLDGSSNSTNYVTYNQMRNGHVVCRLLRQHIVWPTLERRALPVTTRRGCLGLRALDAGRCRGLQLEKWRASQRLSLAAGTAFADAKAIAEARNHRLQCIWQRTVLELAESGTRCTTVAILPAIRPCYCPIYSFVVLLLADSQASGCLIDCMAIAPRVTIAKLPASSARPSACDKTSNNVVFPNTG